VSGAKPGLLSGIFEIQQIMQAEGCSWEIAQQRWQESMQEPAENNVIAVDFRGRRSAALD
jgi:hypothetical protein